MENREIYEKNEIKDELAIEIIGDETIVEVEEKTSRNHICIFFIIMLVIIVGLYLLLGKKAIMWIHDRLQHLVQSHNILPRVVLLLCQVPFGTILFLPGLFYFNVMQSILMKRMIESWLISFFGSYLTSLGVFLVIRRCCLESVKKRFAHYGPYIMFQEETKLHPIRDGIIINFVFIPVSIKNYLLGVSSLTFEQTMIALIPGPAVLCFLSAIVGSEVNNIQDLFTDKPFSKKTTWERISFIFSIILVIITLLILVATSVYYKRKYSAFQKRKADIQILPTTVSPNKIDSNDIMV